MQAPPLAEVLTALLPDRLDTLLLRGCLGDASSAADAWEAWLSDTGGLPRALSERPASRRLMPLLHHSLREHRVAIADPDLAILRAASLWELQRAAEIRTILVRVMDALREAGIRAIVIDAVAAGAAAYPAFELRHCHDIGLLVEKAELVRAREALLAAGLAHVGGAGGEEGRSFTLVYEGGLPIVLHTAPWAATEVPDAAVDLWRRSAAAELDSVRLAIFNPTDMLLRICGQGFEPTGPGNWEWGADAAMIIRRHGKAALDWAALVERAKEYHLAFRMSLRLHYLANRLGLPIPAEVLHELARAAWQGQREERERSLSLARGAFGVSLNVMLRRGGWRSRLAIAQWAVRRSPRLLGIGR